MKNKILNMGINLLRTAREFNECINSAEAIVDTMTTEDKLILRDDKDILNQQEELEKLFDEIREKI